MRAQLLMIATLAGCGVTQRYTVDDPNGDVPVAAGSTLAIYADVPLRDLEITADPSCMTLTIDDADPKQGTLVFAPDHARNDDDGWACECSTYGERMDGDARYFRIRPLRHVAVVVLGDPANPKPIDDVLAMWTDALASRHAFVFRGARVALTAMYWGPLAGHGLETWTLEGATRAGEAPRQRRLDIEIVDDTRATVLAAAPGVPDATLELEVVDAPARMYLDSVRFGATDAALDVFPTATAFSLRPLTATGEWILGAIDYAVEDVATGERVVAGTSWSIDAAPIREHLTRTGRGELRVTAAGLTQVVRFALRTP